MAKEKLIKDREYTLENGVLTVLEGVRHIPEGCFRDDRSIGAVVLPSTLISIGKNAFKCCSRLVGEVKIPESVKCISDEAFEFCNIRHLILGKSLEYIGSGAFAHNDLETVDNYSENLKLIDCNAFSGIGNKISRFNVNSKYVYMHSNSFNDLSEVYGLLGKVRILNLYNDDYATSDYVCSYKDRDSYTYENNVLKIKSGVEVIGDFDGFGECKRIELPDSVIIIQNNAFAGLTNLKEVKFSNNLLFIGSGAFEECSLREESITLPKSICSICYNSFSSNSGSEKIKVYNHSTFYGLEGTSRGVFEYIDDDEFIFEDSKNISNINELMMQDVQKLSELNLLSSTILDNSQINSCISTSQSDAIKSAIINFVIDNNYNENIHFEQLKQLLDMKMANISDIHNVINVLFERNQIKTIYLFMSYGYDYKNNCMISRAIISGMADMVEVLLILGADVNETGDITMTPLSIACQNGNYNLVKYLIEKNALVNKVDSNNKKAIDYAIENNHDGIVNLINGFVKEESEEESDLKSIQMILDK